MDVDHEPGAQRLEAPPSGDAESGSFSSIRGGRWSVAIIVLFLLVVTSYTLTIPLGEAYDEWAHFAYIRYVVNEGKLPASGQRLLPEVAWDETHQPPLYYALGALATQGIDMRDDLRPKTNPHLPDGYTLNAYIRGPEQQWPWKGSVLGMRVARGLSMAMGALTVLLTYRIGRRLAPDRPEIALAAMAITAFSPQFVFSSSIITNDIGVAFFSTLALFLLVRIAQDPSVLDMFLLCLAVLAAMFSKANGVALLPAAAIVWAAALLRRRTSLSGAKRLGLAAGGLFLALSTTVLLAKWESWNAYLQGHHSSVSGAITRYILPAILGSPAQRGQILNWSILPDGLAYMYRTFWAAFGMGNIEVDGAFYVVMGVITLLALLGIVARWRRAPEATRRALAVLLLVTCWAMAPPIFLIVSSHVKDVSPGRYLMSLVPVVGLCQALGLAKLAPPRRWRLVLGGYVLLLMVFTALAPWRFIRPAYAYPSRVSQARLAEVAEPLEFRFGEAMALVGFRADATPARPGEVVEVTLYWQCLEKMDEDYTVSVQLLDPDYVFYGGAISYPGRGNYATTLWEPGEIIQDRYWVRLGDDFPPPAFSRIKVDVYRYESYTFLPLTTPRGRIESNAAVFGRLRVIDPAMRRRAPIRSMEAIFGDAIALVGHSVDGVVPAGSEARIALRWRALAPVDRDYTVFVHLVDGDGQVVAQGDGQPFGGRYPMSLWARDDDLREARSLAVPAQLPAGAYHIAIGVYWLENLERLPAAGPKGGGLPLDQYLIPIEIAPMSPR